VIAAAVAGIAAEADHAAERDADAPPRHEPTPDEVAAERDRAARDRYRNILEAAVPPRQRPATLAQALGVYQADADKAAAAAAAETFAREGSVVERGAERCALLLTGAFGVGKTWLATAVFKQLVWNDVAAEVPGGPARYVWAVFDDFVRDVQDTYSAASERTSEAALARYRDAAVLLLDDVGDLDAPGAESDDRRRLLYSVLNHRSNWLLPTLLTSNLAPNDLQNAFGGRSVQRVVEMCALVGMGGANLRLGS